MRHYRLIDTIGKASTIHKRMIAAQPRTQVPDDTGVFNPEDSLITG